MPPEDNPRKIPPSSIVIAALILCLSLLAGSASAWKAGSFGAGVLLQLPLFVIVFYAVALACYRAFLATFPLREGPVTTGPTAFAYCTYMLLNVFVFYPFLQSSFLLPFPFRRPIYQLMGARLGKNTHCPGVLLDPPLMDIGDFVVIGGESIFACHAAEGDLFMLARIRIGNRATIGGRAIVGPGVTIGEGAVVAAGAVVVKGVQIGPKEVWGGVPARLLKTMV